MDNYVIGSTMCLTIVEILGMSMLRTWARTNYTICLCGGIVSFSIIAIMLGHIIRISKSMILINAFWQASSIVGVSLISILYFKESTTTREMFGIIFAFIASLCFM